MSNLIHCDGPDCEQTKPLAGSRRLCDGDWLMLEQGEALPNLDFHSRACLAAWSSLLCSPGIPRPYDQPCTCHRAHTNPHTKADHQAYPTAVDGL